MKRFLPIVALMLVATIASSQSRFGGGIGAGFTVSQISGDGLAGFNKPGAFAGVFGNYSLNPKSWLQMELNFIQKGSYKAPNADDPTQYTLNLNYIELPILYRFMPIGKHFVFELGPTFGYLINYKERSELGDININLPFKKLEIAVLAGVNYHLGKGIWVNFRAMQSVAPVRDHQGDVVFRLNRGQYSSTLGLSFRYVFQQNTNK